MRQTKWVILGVIGMIAIVAFSVSLTIGSAHLDRFVTRITAPIRGETEEIEITNTGAYRVQGYERFYDLHEDVAAVDQKLKAYPASLDTRQLTECVGLLARRADLVSEYNSSSRAERTTGQWRAADLPETLEHDSPRTCEGN